MGWTVRRGRLSGLSRGLSKVPHSAEVYVRKLLLADFLTVVRRDRAHMVQKSDVKPRLKLKHNGGRVGGG